MIIKEEEYKQIKDGIECEENLKNNKEMDNINVIMKFYKQSYKKSKWVIIESWEEELSYISYINKLKTFGFEFLNYGYYISDTCIGKAIVLVKDTSLSKDSRLIWMFDFIEK